jgi:ligand-binding sensor domain-containing protein
LKDTVSERAIQPIGADSVRQIGKSIRCILQDKAGNFWFATDGEGVCRYDGTSFRYFTEKDGLSSKYVWTIQEDKAGNIWFGTRDGVCRYDGKSFTTIGDITRQHKIGSWSSLSSRPEHLWFATQGGVCGYDGKSFAYFQFTEADNQAQFSSNPYSVYCICEDKTGNLWFGTQSKGVCRYDGKAFTWFAKQGLGGAAVRAIFQDKAGNLWFGNNGGGVYRYDGKILTNFTEQQGLSNPDFLRTLKGKPGTLARVWSIVEDKIGNLWFGTVDAGAWRYDGNALTNFTIKDGLASDAINIIYKDNSGDLWFGTDGGGVSKYTGKSFVNFTRSAQQQ